MLNRKFTSRLCQAGLGALGLLVACGGSTSRPEPDASSQGPRGGAGNHGTPTGGEKASAGGAVMPTPGGAPNEGGAPAVGGAGGMAEAGAAASGGTSASGGMVAAAGAGSAGAGPVHDRCADPLQIGFVNGEAAVSDDTSRATDEFPTLNCGGLPEQGLPGGQIYYRFTARPGREYALRLKAASFAPVEFYVFPAVSACEVQAIRTACSSAGVTGTRSGITASVLTHFAPRAPGDYIIGVDGTLAQGAPFTLNVFEYCGSSGGTD